MIQWSEEYRLGLADIDEQHKNLFAIANKAYDLLKNELRTDKYDQIMEILDELRDYTVTHFSQEEEYMASIGYPKLLSHKVQHSDFIEKISNVDLNSVDANQEKYLFDLLDFFADWLVNHILKTDRMYVGG
ncbi:bacteriohemerythrin [Anaeroselena agilis]|uniref:Bacteriohemerythrin n=1 Tax=Anaeroselena agilis TaxID=3063788 RepID=A0ABU3P011_9FIRM|nr:bacteriohemerythrin [Selenomonadales bacterium 4137-cl]